MSLAQPELRLSDLFRGSSEGGGRWWVGGRRRPMKPSTPTWRSRGPGSGASLMLERLSLETSLDGGCSCSCRARTQIRICDLKLVEDKDHRKAAVNDSC